MLNFKNVEVPVFSGPGPAGGAFSAPLDPLADHTGYRLTLPRLSKSQRTATGYDVVETFPAYGLPGCSACFLISVRHLSRPCVYIHITELMPVCDYLPREEMSCDLLSTP